MEMVENDQKPRLVFDLQMEESRIFFNPGLLLPFALLFRMSFLHLHVSVHSSVLSGSISSYYASLKHFSSLGFLNWECF